MVENPTTKDVGDNIQQQMDVEEVLIPDFGNWEVKDDGGMLYCGTKIGIKEIPASCLKNEHLTQMLGKFAEEESAQFYFAYLQALKNAGFKSMTIDLAQIHNIKFEEL